MRASRADMERSHARIVESAGRRIREAGLEDTGVAEVMREAGLTHGGFYRHFADKAALLEAALDSAFDDMVSLLRRAAPDFAVRRAYYLSDSHVAAPANGCPAAALATETARAPAALKARFGAGIGRIVASLAETLPGTPAARRRRAWREFATMVGAVALARASDPATAKIVLAAVRPTGASNAVSEKPPMGPARRQQTTRAANAGGSRGSVRR